MTALARSAAVDRLERLVDAVEEELLPVPVREIWTFGDVALGLDPVDRLDVYLTKDVLLRDDSTDSGIELDPRVDGIDGVGESVRAEWANQYPEAVRANRNGHAAPEKCLAAHLVESSEPIHLEVCNTSFEQNVTQRLRGARLRGEYGQLLDPRGVCLWVDGQRSEDAFRKLRASELAFPTLSGALEMLGMDEDEAAAAADAHHEWRASREGVSVRGDVI